MTSLYTWCSRGSENCW